MDPPSQVKQLQEICSELEPLLQEKCLRICELWNGQVSLENNRLLELSIQLVKMGEDPREPIADILFNLKAYKDASEIYRELANETEKAMIWNNLGVSLSKLGQDNEAIDVYRRGLKLNPSSPKLWFNLGKAFNRRRDIKQALRAFTNCVQFAPRNKSAWNNMGVCYRTLGNMKEAMKCYEQAAQIDPNYAWAWHNMGILALNIGDKEAAELYFRTALKAKPDYKPSIDMLRNMERN